MLESGLCFNLWPNHKKVSSGNCQLCASYILNFASYANWLQCWSHISWGLSQNQLYCEINISKQLTLLIQDHKISNSPLTSTSNMQMICGRLYNKIFYCRISKELQCMFRKVIIETLTSIQSQYWTPLQYWSP